MADVRIEISAVDQSRQQILDLRRNINRVNREVQENNELQQISNRTSRETLQARTQNLRLQRAQLSLQREQLQIASTTAREEQRVANASRTARERAARDALTYRRTQVRETQRAAREEQQAVEQAARAERRERQQAFNAARTFRRTQARDAEQASRAEIQAARQTSRARQSFLTDISIITREANRQLLRFTSNLVTASARMETFAATIRVAETDSRAARNALERLLEVTVELVGIDTADLLGFYSRFRSVGIDQERAISAISGVTKAIAQQGKDAVTTRLVLEQLTQAISSGRIIYQDFRTIFQQLPTFTRIASEALGEQIRTIEDFRTVAQETVGETEAIIQVFEHLNQTSRGADLSTLNAQLEIFRDLLFVTGAEAGAGVANLITDLLITANGLLEVFRGLNPSMKASIGLIAATATGLTGLATVASVATVAMGALNASMTQLTGVSGFAGIGRLLASGGPVLAGLGAFAGVAGIAAANSALILSQRVEEASTANDKFAESLNEVSAALRGGTDISQLRQSIEEYVSTLEDAGERGTRQLGRLAIAGNFLAGLPGPVGDLGRATRDLSSAINSVDSRTIDDAVVSYESLLSVLENVREASDLSITQLRQLDVVVARALNEARDAGNTELVQSLENAANAVRGLYAEFETGRARTVNVFTPVSESVTSLSAQLIELDNQLAIAQQRARGADGADAIANSYQELARLTRESGDAQLQQIQLQIDAEGALLSQQDSTAERREEIQNRLIDLTFEYRETKLRIEREVTQVETQEAQKREQLAQAAARNRIAYERRVRDARVEYIQDFAERFRDAIAEFDNQGQVDRFSNVFGAFVNQGQGFDEALVSAQNYINLFDLFPSVLQTTDVGVRQLTASVRTGLSVAISEGTGLINDFRDALRGAARADADLNLRINSQGRREVEPSAPGETTVESLEVEQQRRDAVELTRLREQQLQEENRLITTNLNERYQLYSQVYTRIGNSITSILTGRYDSVADAAQQLAASLLTYIIQNEIQQRLSDARELALNTAKANAKIANEKRVQAEVIQTALVAQGAQAGQTGLGIGTAAAGGGLGILGPLGLVAGAALLVSSLVNNRGQEGIGASDLQQRSPNENKYYFQFDDGVTREISASQDRLEKENRR